MIKSPYTGKIVAPKVKLPEPNVFDISVIINLKKELDTELDKIRALGEQMRQDHEAKLAEVDAKLIDHTTTVQQIVDDKLEEVDDTLEELKQVDFTGQPGTSVSHDEVVKDVLSKVFIPKPKDGVSPVVDTLAIAKVAARLIPKPKDGVTPKIDSKAIAEQVFEEIKNGKKKLSLSHIGDFNEGLEQTMRPIRSLMAGFRGGGDVVTAGSNITITTDANGKKVITGSAGGGNFTENEVVAGSGTTFTLAATPVAGSVKVYALGQRLVLTTDYSIVGTAVTTVNSWSAGQIVADYRT